MLNYFRRTAQVVALTFVLIFSSLLMIGGLEVPSWSDAHHGYSHERIVHIDRIFWWYTGELKVHQEYHNGGHGNDTIHS